MIFSVTTLRDTPRNVEKFVRRNLAGGVDHMIVFLDGEQPEVAALLEANPYVTPVTTDDAWWGADRPAPLNVRQLTNAEVARRVLRTLEGARWLFHIDGDEVLRLDRDVLDAIEPRWQVVALATLEAVGGMHPEGDPTWFK
ncbi:MAG: glycosyltransferase family 2 protein, partial [Nocardioides sp.]